MQSDGKRSTVAVVMLMMACVLCVATLLCGCAQQQPVVNSNAAPQEQEAAAETSTAANEGENSEAAKARQEQANALAKQYTQKAAAEEPAVTQALQEFENGQAKLVGLEHRLKSEESFARKVISLADDEEISLEAAAASIYDALRYTICIEPEVYVSKATELLKGLEAKGYAVNQFSNRWDGEEYKGLNTKLATPSGYVFELQIHTPQSYEVKEATHKYYETARRDNATAEEVEEANRMQREMTAAVVVPEGAVEFTWK